MATVAIQGRGVQWAVKRIVDWVSKTVNSVLGFQQLIGIDKRYHPEGYDPSGEEQRMADLAKTFGWAIDPVVKMTDLLHEVFRPEGCKSGELYI